MKTITLTILALLLLAACAVEQPVQKIKIGVSVPMTGPATATGEWVRQGYEIALGQLPEDERSSIELVYEDDQCNIDTGMTVARKFVEIDKTKFVLGPLCGVIVKATADYYDSNKIIRMVSGGGFDMYRTMGEYKFAFLGYIEEWMKTLGHYSAEKGIKTVGILYIDDDYGKENSLYFEKYFTEAGGQIIAKEPFARGETDFRTQLIKIKNVNPDAILIGGYGSILVNILKQIDELDLQSVKLSLYNTEDPEIVKSAGNLTEGIIYPMIIDDTESEIKTLFSEKYLEEYGINNVAASAPAFDSFNVLWSAIKKCGEDADCVYNDIHNIKQYSGASGAFSVDEHGVALRNSAIKIVKNGKFVYAEEAK